VVLARSWGHLELHQREQLNVIVGLFDAGLLPATTLTRLNFRHALDGEFLVVDAVGVLLPVAFVPTHIHPRMAAQRSRFTVWGKEKRSLPELEPDGLLRRFVLNPAKKAEFQRDLRMLVAQEASAFPDLDGVAREHTHLDCASGAGHSVV